jgi:hypothetical protein
MKDTSSFKVIMQDGEVFYGSEGEWLTYSFKWTDDEGVTVCIPYASINRVIHYPEGKK